MSWHWVYEDFDSAHEKHREALCTLGNGYFATRGAAPESDSDEHHYPGTYLAFGYNRAVTSLLGRTVENEDLVNFPNWLSLKFRFEAGAWVSLQDVEILHFRQELDLRFGKLSREFRIRNAKGQILKVSQRRFVHMRRRHVAALETTFEAENFDGFLEVRTALEGRLLNAGVFRYRALNSVHLHPVEARAVGDEEILLQVQTQQSEIHMVQAARTRVWKEEQLLSVPRQNECEALLASQTLRLSLEKGVPLRVEKLVTIFTSKDFAISNPQTASLAELRRLGKFDSLLEEHRVTWSHLWRRFDIRLTQKSGAYARENERVLRLHIFHLLQTASPNTMDLDVGVPARGLHGEAYRGHVFWDELFIFPFLNWRLPEITRALLRYRIRRLPQAQASAQAAGFQGAMYPWQSGSDGREETQKLHLNPLSGRWLEDATHLQRHVNAAIVYNVWQYFQVTYDMEFLAYGGAEMVLEIARFFASISKWNSDCSRYEILNVMGPDEYHDRLPGRVQVGLDNNAYTNVMAVWVLVTALEVLKVLPSRRAHELLESLRMSQADLQRFEDVSRKMKVAFFEDSIISQFEGYENLAELDWESYRRKYGDIQRLDRILEAEGDSVNSYKVSKQADVLMLLYVFSPRELAQLFDRLGYFLSAEAMDDNVKYYMSRTSHGSTLSRVVHSWAMARRNRAQSWQLFLEALRSDIAATPGGTTSEGIHLGAMSGTVDLVQRGYTGIVIEGDVLSFDPLLPEEVTCLHLDIHFRGHSLAVHVTDEQLEVEASHSCAEPIRIGCRGKVAPLVRGEKITFSLRGES